jgi:hypothetical protein
LEERRVWMEGVKKAGEGEEGKGEVGKGGPVGRGGEKRDGAEEERTLPHCCLCHHTTLVAGEHLLLATFYYPTTAPTLACLHYSVLVSLPFLAEGSSTSQSFDSPLSKNWVHNAPTPVPIAARWYHPMSWKILLPPLPSQRAHAIQQKKHKVQNEVPELSCGVLRPPHSHKVGALGNSYTPRGPSHTQMLVNTQPLCVALSFPFPNLVSCGPSVSPS